MLDLDPVMLLICLFFQFPDDGVKIVFMFLHIYTSTPRAGMKLFIDVNLFTWHKYCFDLLFIKSHIF